MSVLLADRLAADLSEADWRLFSEDAVTVLVHEPVKGRPDAVVYVEAPSALAELSPAEEARRFQLTVDPGMAGGQVGWSPAWEDLARALDSKSEAERALDLQALRMAATRTGGRGIGYVSSSGSFSGWKWIGRNRGGVFLRLAQSRGEWSEPAALDPGFRPSLEQLAKRFPTLEWMQAGLLRGGGGGEERRAAEPAHMVFGSAESSNGVLHLALVCIQRPACGPARDLAGLLGSLRPARLADAERSREPLSLTDLEYDLGIVVMPRSWILEIPASSS